MKKLLPLLLLIPFFAFVDLKPLTVKLTLEQWQKHLNGMQYINNVLINSDLPSRQVKYIQDSVIVPLQTDIINQVRPQIDTTKKK